MRRPSLLLVGLALLGDVLSAPTASPAADGSTLRPQSLQQQQQAWRDNVRRQSDDDQQTAQQQAAQVPQGVSQATDGGSILDTTVTVNGLDLRFKISGPPSQFSSTSGVAGGGRAPGSQGELGLNVLLHGDGGQSFFDFPNQAVQGGLAGVVVLAPDPNLFWGGGSGLDRTDGVAHAQAVNDLVLEVLPQLFAFDPSKVFFTGVSGGSLLLSGFFMPAHLANFARVGARSVNALNGVLLNCGGLEPQVAVSAKAAAAVAATKIHFQSTQRELDLLQGSIPDAIKAYEAVAVQAGLKGAAQIGQVQTVDNSPDGGHCEFDGQGFVSGIQLVADNFASILQGGNGNVDGIGNVLTSVVGNEDLSFLPGA